MKKRIPIVLVMLMVTAGSLNAQLIFEKSEYVLRREKLMDMIPDGICCFQRGFPP